MKRHALLFLLFLGSSPFLCAQLVQYGQVRELNSGKQPVAAVQITYSGAVPTSSDGSGRFRLAFQDKEPGEWVFLEEVRKSGFELVNNKEVEQFKLSNSDRLGTDIILAREGVLATAKAEYYGISSEALTANYKKEIAALRRQLEATAISKDSFREKYEFLTDQFEAQRARLDQLADRFARTNFDDVSSLYQEALQHFKEGKIAEAEQAWEEANPVERVKQRLEERRRINAAQAELERDEQRNERGLGEDLEQALNLAETYVLQFKTAKAEQLFDDLLEADSTNLEILQKAGTFFMKSHNYSKGTRVFDLITEHPQATLWEQANAAGNSGDIFLATGKLKHAKRAYRKSNRIYTDLCLNASTVSFLQLNLIISYDQIGISYDLSGQLDSALQNYEMSLLLSQILHEDMPGDPKITERLAIAHSRLGSVFFRLEQIDSALNHYTSSIVLIEKLTKKIPKDLSALSQLSITYSRLGDIHAYLKNWGSAMYYYDKDMALAKDLYEEYPRDPIRKISLGESYSNKGEIYSKIGPLDSALYYFEQYLQINQEAHEVNPLNVFIKNELATSYLKLGDVYHEIKQAGAALQFYREAESLWRDLKQLAPESADYDALLASVQRRVLETEFSKYIPAATEAQDSVLAVDTDKEKVVRQRSLVAVWEEAYRSYPQNSSITTQLANEWANLSWYQLSAGSFSEAEHSARHALEIDETQEWIVTNLAAALLFQGEWAAARTLYEAYMDTAFNEQLTFRDMFLEDLETLEAAGITHPDVARARALLE